MSICSLVLFAKPENVPEVEKEIAAMEGVEIHGSTEAGKMVVCIDHPDRTHCSEMIMGMSNVSGVLNTSLIYEYYE